MVGEGEFGDITLVACEQTFRGALATGREKEGEICNCVSGVWISASKSRCEMLIGGDDISNDVITLDNCFSMFV